MGMDEIENRLTGERATIMRDRVNHRTLITKSASTPSEPPTLPTTQTEKAKAEKTKKQPKAEGPKTEKEAKPTKPALKEIEQKVLSFLKRLDHPATSNEVRDKFNFSLRAPARRIFRKLQKLGYGENRKIGKAYKFFVKDKVYPPPKTEQKDEEIKENK
jgi:hypothetical protein